MKTKLPIFLVICLLPIQQVFADTNLKSIQASINDKNAGWTAKEIDEDAAYSGYGFKQLKAGAIEEGPSIFSAISSDELEESSFLESALPSNWDWRDVDGRNFMSAMGQEQGECGSCVAFAMTATLEATLNIACNNTDAHKRLSRQHLFSCGGGSCTSGWKVSSAVRYLESNGVPDEPCFTYSAGNGSDISCSQTCSDHGDRSVVGFSSERPTTGFVKIEKIKSALLKAPLLANLVLYEDLQYYKSGVYKYVAGNKQGGHAVSIVGWDDSKAAWIVRNSWGENWGEGGISMQPLMIPRF